MMKPRVMLVLVMLIAAIAGLAFPRSAWAVDNTLAGSVQLDYMLVPSAPKANARSNAFDGFTTEATVKLVVDVSDHLSASVKVCFGCHGFEADMAYAEYRLSPELGLRAGRFSPSFGAFNLRHDPANHGLSSKPLPYDMGRMLRLNQWDMSVLPSPFPDNGAEIGGTHWFGDTAQIDYAAYAVAGFKAAKDATDIDWIQSRSPSLYYVDNNARPAVGGRFAGTLRLGDDSDVSLGGSFMYGTLDRDNTISYAIAGADVTFRANKTIVRAEYLSRRQDLDTSDPSRFKYSISKERGDFFTKHGAYVELEQRVSSHVTLLARADGMARFGNVAAGSELVDGSTVIRGTLGGAYSFERGIRLKLSSEYWRFSDNDASGYDKAVSLHVAVVGSF
jgi:hypothetical protein